MTSDFYPRDAMLSRVYATVFPSVSVTRVLCVKTAKRLVQILLPPNSQIILGFRHSGPLLNSDGFIPNGGAEYKGVVVVRWGEKIGRFVANKSVYL